MLITRLNYLISTILLSFLRKFHYVFLLWQILAKWRFFVWKFWFAHVFFLVDFWRFFIIIPVFIQHTWEKTWISYNFFFLGLSTSNIYSYYSELCAIKLNLNGFNYFLLGFGRGRNSFLRIGQMHGFCVFVCLLLWYYL